jgi:NAD(P)-dependent dehydrogenase (short-subunit alcohol dehydrogenase family)
MAVTTTEKNVSDNLNGKVVFVTGAATGIGAEVCRGFASLGAKVAVCDINAEAGVALAAEIGGEFIGCDVTDFDRVEAAVARCVKALGVPDYAHLNAGIMTVPTNDPFLAIEDVTSAQYRKIVGVNLDGMFHGVKALLPQMRERGGAITLTASTAGLSVLGIDPLYAATKHAVIGFGRAVAAANELNDLRINVICPGVVETAIVPDAFKAPEFAMMPAAMMAEEVIDLLLSGANGEVRVKNSAEVPAFVVAPQSESF